MRFLVCGSAGGATSYFAEVSRALGFKTGHEKVFDCTGGFNPKLVDQNDVEVSWAAVPYLFSVPRDVQIIHLVRHPVKQMATWMKIHKDQVRVSGKNLKDNSYWKALPFLGLIPTWGARAVYQWVAWNSLIEPFASHRILVEHLDASALVEAGLCDSVEKADKAIDQVPRNVNSHQTKTYPGLDSYGDGHLLGALKSMAKRYGYL